MTAHKPPAVDTTARDDPAESQRFIDMAREVGVDESPEAFERAFRRVTAKPVTVPLPTAPVRKHSPTGESAQ